MNHASMHDERVEVTAKALRLDFEALIPDVVVTAMEAAGLFPTIEEWTVAHEDSREGGGAFFISGNALCNSEEVARYRATESGERYLPATRLVTDWKRA